MILMTAQGSIDAAVEAMKLGAYDFIEKPVNPTRLRNILQNAVPPARHRARTGSHAPHAARQRAVGPAGRRLAKRCRKSSTYRDGGAEHGVAC